MSGSLNTSTPINRRLAGITAAQIDGIAYPVTEFSWDPATVKRETMTSLSGVDGYSELPKAPYIAGKFRDGASVSVTSFNGKTNSTIVFVLANGKRIQGHNMWNTGECEVAGVDATFDFKFEGIPGSVIETGATAS